MTIIPEDVTDTYLGGKCFALAYALHERFGWPIQAKVERYAADESEYAAHVWILHPFGQALDITGLHPVQKMSEAYGSPHGKFVQFSGYDFLEFAEVDDDDPEDTFWDDVEEARTVMEDYVIPSYIQSELPKTFV